MGSAPELEEAINFLLIHLYKVWQHRAEMDSQEVQITGHVVVTSTSSHLLLVKSYVL